MQFVRTLSGFNSPSQADEAAFRHAVEKVTVAARGLIMALEITSPPRKRETEAMKARARARARFGAAR